MTMAAIVPPLRGFEVWFEVVRLSDCEEPVGDAVGTALVNSFEVEEAVVAIEVMTEEIAEV